MAFITIPSTLIEVGKAIKKELFQTIKDSLDDHESRISALSGGANKIQVFEYNVRPDQLDIGKIIPADMTLAEFQAIYGAGWIIADGSSCTGSVYASVTGHTIVPDLRDEFLRGVSGSVLLGTAYADSTAVNGMTVDSGGAHAHTVPATSSPTGGADFVLDGAFGRATAYNAPTSSAGAHVHTLSGDSETRPQNFGVNFFIKINLSAQDNTLRIKASAAMTITSARGYITDNNGLPTSGNFEFDVKKGATIAALTSVYSTKPILAYSGGIADGDSTSGGTISAGGYSVAAGDWLQLDVTSIMAGQSGVYIRVYAESA